MKLYGDSLRFYATEPVYDLNGKLMSRDQLKQWLQIYYGNDIVVDMINAASVYEDHDRFVVLTIGPDNESQTYCPDNLGK